MPIVNSLELKNRKKFDKMKAAYCLIMPDDKMYFGSTSNLYNRMRQHRQNSNKPYDNEAVRTNPEMYEHIYNSGGWSKVIVAYHVCDSIEEARESETDFWNSNFGQKSSFNCESVLPKAPKKVRFRDGKWYYETSDIQSEEIEGTDDDDDIPF